LLFGGEKRRGEDPLTPAFAPLRGEGKGKKGSLDFFTPRELLTFFRLIGQKEKREEEINPIKNFPRTKVEGKKKKRLSRRSGVTMALAFVKSRRGGGEKKKGGREKRHLPPSNPRRRRKGEGGPWPELFFRA